MLRLGLVLTITVSLMTSIAYAATKNIVPPTFPDHSVMLTDFGAVSDGQTDNTQAFARAIDAVVQAGGGRLVVPTGIWRTGPIQLKSNLDLHLEIYL